MNDTPQLEDGYLMIANELLEAILGFGFSLREQSVLLTIIRKTYGFRKKEDDLSASQIGAMCCVQRQHVTSTLNALALRNVITKRPGRYGSIIGVQKDHRKWITAERMKGHASRPDSGQEGDRPADQNSGNQGDSLVPKQDTCPESGLVPNQDTPCPETGQVDSPNSGHTKYNLPKDNYQNTKSCAPQAERDLVGDLPAGKKQRRAMTGTKEQKAAFEKLYEAYPRKRSRMAAEKAFLKLNPDEQLLATMLTAIERAAKSDEWSNPAFIPHPSTWLNERRWEDVIQTEYAPEELGTIQLFNEMLGSRLGEVPESPFSAKRAAAIRDFTGFQEKPQLAERFFTWLRDEKINLPPHVGFDWLLTREGFTKACAGNRADS